MIIVQIYTNLLSEYFFHLIKRHTSLGKLIEYSTIALVGSLQQQAKSEYEILAFE